MFSLLRLSTALPTGLRVSRSSIIGLKPLQTVTSLNRTNLIKPTNYGLRYQSTQPIKKQMVIERELPDPLKEVRSNRYKFIAFVTLMGISSFLIFNYEKLNSPIVTTTLHFLRRSQTMKDVLGEKIDFASAFPWVRGQLNQVQGKVNIEFHVKGTKGEGKIKLRADREDRLSDFLIHEWCLIDDKDGKVYDLLEDDTVDFAV
ncbi:hypothetical protein WICPIJ_006825 [Wickerhamomyces pijperi]|uniref:Cytochrome c oxidase assembly factor 1 n=1 Tax=Wickerhamomyces pijperi TaxID=599730 RepID=A0A9P8TKL3_WICPI|nr:hypothetical protein WICPIJ_006825 [Wickerhamomyces pijperi]